MVFETISNFLRTNGARISVVCWTQQNTAAIRASEMLIHVAGHLKQQSKLTAELVLDNMFFIFAFILTFHQLSAVPFLIT